MKFYNTGLFIMTRCIAKFVILILLLIHQTISCSQEIEYFSFENTMGTGWDDKIFGHPWLLDYNGYGKNNGSIRSAYLGKETSTIGLGVSSLSRDVTGPADISFWWRYDAVPQGGMLYFIVDNRKTSYICDHNWTRVLYTIPKYKTEKIEWRFEVTDSQKLNVGAGWVDELYINHTTLTKMTDYDDKTKVTNINETEASEVNETEASEVNETEASEVNETEASEVNETEASEVNETEASEVNRTTYVDRLHLDPQNYIYASITEAIKHVEDGGTVKVGSGIYKEHVNIYKSLSLVSINEGGAHIGDHNGENVLSIYSNDVSIDGFVISGGQSGIYILNGSHCTFRRNSIHGCKTGINLLGGSFCKIYNNTIYDCDYGMHTSGVSNLDINKNEISSSQIGVQVIKSSCAFNKNNLSGCEIGLSLKDNVEINVQFCNLTNILTGGIHIDNSSDCYLGDTSLAMNAHSNNFGIYLINSNNNEINKNTIMNSNYGIIFDSGCTGNTIKPDNKFLNIRICDIYFHVKDDFKNTSCPGVCKDASISSSDKGICKKCEMEI